VRRYKILQMPCVRGANGAHYTAVYDPQRLAHNAFPVRAIQVGRRQAMFPGLKAALNFHPLFVHFPIVLWLVALFFELLAIWHSSDELQRTASRLLYLGTLAAIVTAMTGLAAESSVPPGEAQRAVGIHEALMLTATSAAIGLCMFAFFMRKNFTAKLRKIMLLGLVLLGVLLTIGADRGAQLVYGYGSAVNWTTAQQQK
jgi:uncharacterized membrane protein